MITLYIKLHKYALAFIYMYFMNLISKNIISYTMYIIIVFRYNLDPFSKYTDEVIWEALEQVHMKEKVL